MALTNWNPEIVSLHQALSYIEAQYYNAIDPNLDGWTTFENKKNLYKLKFRVDELLAKCSTYKDEAEWVRDYKTKMAFERLERG